MMEDIEVRAGEEAYGMKFMEKIEPSFGDGKISVHAVQKVRITKEDGETITDKLTARKDFLVASRAFTLDASDVYSVSPGENACGNFSNELPHITFSRRTYPWEHQSAYGEPWLALLPLTEGEYEEREITVGELMGEEGEDVYFPVSAQPEIYMEKDSDICHVIDLDRELFEYVAPCRGERALLAHGKFLNLLEKTDETVRMDGYFSTVVGGRFVPSAGEDVLKCVIHLVSMLGYDDPGEIPGKCPKIRLVSLYRWSVFSGKREEPGFVSLMEGIHCDVFKIEKDNALLQHGYVPKRHLFRSGESTVSLYRGPLLPFEYEKKKTEASAEKMPATADGALIFDRDTALFDTSYGAAWQLGRLLTLENKGMAAAVVKWRRQVERVLLRRSASAFLYQKINRDYSPEMVARLAAERLLCEVGENAGCRDKSLTEDKEDHNARAGEDLG